MTMTRKDFLGGAAALAATGAMSGGQSRKDKIWCMYQQLGWHFWATPFPLDENGHFCGESTPISDDYWQQHIAKCKEIGCNMMCVDVGEGLVYPSHPELALKGSRSPEWMHARIRELNAAGIEVIPSLNFSMAHDAWLGWYSRMVSTPTYYQVCRDLIRDVWDVFNHPRFINFGMDEETPDVGDDPKRPLCAFRQGDLLWHDIDFYTREVEKVGARPWMWSDLEWWYPDAYVKHVSKEVVQSNWYYEEIFKLEGAVKPFKQYLGAYLHLEEAGYDQIPGCSNWMSNRMRKIMKRNDVNIPGTFKFCSEHIADERLLGINCMAWGDAGESGNREWLDAADLFGKSIKDWKAGLI